MLDIRFTTSQLALDRAETELTKKLSGRQEFVDMLFSEVQKTFDARFRDVQTMADTRFTITQGVTNKTEIELTRQIGEGRAYVDVRFTDLLTTMNAHFAAIQKLVYIGLGAVLALELVLKFLTK